MRKTLSIAILLATAAFATVFALAPAPEKASIGAVSPNFTVNDSNGKTVALNNLRGKYVVLEWTNKDCPFVQKHYGSGNMQNIQEKAKEMGATWYSVISSADGAPGYMSPAEVNEYRKENNVKSVATLIDTKGTVGHIYSARATPQIVIINPKGVVIYNGAIDDKPSPDPSTIQGARNYALEALKESMAGKEVAVSTSRPYGCGIKYSDL